MDAALAEAVTEARVSGTAVALVQGFHLARPLPAAEATAALRAGFAPERRR